MSTPAAPILSANIPKIAEGSGTDADLEPTAANAALMEFSTFYVRDVRGVHYHMIYHRGKQSITIFGIGTREDIVLGFRHPKVRHYTGFAVG